MRATIRKYRRPNANAAPRFERVVRGLMHAAPARGERLVVFRELVRWQPYQGCTWSLCTTEVKRVVCDLFARRLIVETCNSRYLITLDEATQDEFAEFCVSDTRRP